MARLMNRLRQRFGAVLTLMFAPLTLVCCLALDDGGDGSGDEGGGDGGGDGSGDQDDSGDADEKDLSDAGKRALSRERSARRDADKARKESERKAKAAEDRLAKVEGDKKSDTDKAIEQARQEARDEATKEAQAKADARVIRSAVREAAATRLADPADALLYLDLDDIDVDDDGEVDRKAIAKALGSLLKDKPYLAADAKTKGNGSADGGARDGANKADPGPGVNRMRAAYAASTTK